MLIDISKWNGDINWSKVKAAGVDGVIIRCGVGTSGVDTKFTTNIKGAINAGIKVGVYTYSKAKTIAAANAEAKNTISAVAPYKNDLYYPVFIDLEQSGTESASKTVAKNFMQTMKDAGYKTGIYCSSSWRKSYLSGVSADYWWIAQWSSKQPANCNFWQYSAKGSVSGISGDVDLDKVISYSPTPSPTPSGGEFEVQCRTIYYRSTGVLTGEDVKSVQKIVGATADGQAGKKTQAAIIAWQKKNGLTADGYFGPKCWEFSCGAR